ncbi:hypothetical protein D9619_011296 [Psilocybe cf. subviscida]|uniref:NACHT domain-containing protein n=1 Tax=Psilocybe cf. subviscida TaxID=2480587 RepID=A0A8H5BJ99_9AGAR|nr:hypothetical protein D9619_011296 [Psilocybe cf. subviscida]
MHNNNIHGNTFVTNVSADITRSLDALYRRVAPNAILNAGGRADEVRCYPGTRKEVISRIERWRDEQDSLVAPIFWLSGPAGAGKTAIVQTVAESCNTQGVPQANFFFFRADGSRNTASALVATLLHQVLQLYPSVRENVATILDDNPLIFDTVLAVQLTQLIISPLHAAQQQNRTARQLTIFIDGLDECDSENKFGQQQILHAFANALAEQPCPFRLLVASRTEPQITMSFNQLSTTVSRLYLNNEHSPDNDIRLFVSAEFQQVRETHLLRHLLDEHWPSCEDQEWIVEKSSGQFIFAATVMRFISQSSACPSLSLERVQGIVQPTPISPFSQLDTIYTHILSRADDQQALKEILHAWFYTLDIRSWKIGYWDFKFTNILHTLRIWDQRYTNSVVYSCISDVNSIALLEDGNLIFHHASLADYLQDQTRSGEYFVDVEVFNAKMLPRLLEHVKHDMGVIVLVYGCLERLKLMTPDVMSGLLALEPLEFQDSDVSTMLSCLCNIHHLCMNDDNMANYRKIMRKWVTHYMSLGLSDFSMKQLHDCHLLLSEKESLQPRVEKTNCLIV